MSKYMILIIKLVYLSIMIYLCIFIVNVDNTVGAVGFVPSLLPVRLHPIAVIKVDATNEPIRGPDGFCVRCAPSMNNS